jgi:glycerol kinase
VARYILALDQGTTSSRAILFDEGGHAVARAQREFPQHFPQPGWVEHEPADLWNSQRETIAEVLKAGKARATDLAAIGIANQRETAMIWDRHTGEPLGRAIVWQDRRTAELCEQLKAAGHEHEVARRAGLLIDPYFSGTKLRWLLDANPGARERASRGEIAFGTIDSWLVWKLTNGAHHVTDVSNASRTLLFNLRTLNWDPVLLEMLDIPPACLPKVVPSQLTTGHGLTTRFPSSASRGTSRPRSSASPASSPGWRRTHTAPVVFF